MDRKKSSEKAIKLLEEVIIDVLTEAKELGHCLGAAEIARRAGMHRLPAGGVEGTINWNDGLQTHILGGVDKLVDARLGD